MIKIPRIHIPFVPKVGVRVVKDKNLLTVDNLLPLIRGELEVQRTSMTVDMTVLTDALKAEAERSAGLQHELTLLRSVLGQTTGLGFKPFNLENVTAELRARVESSIKVDYDGNNITVRGYRPLTEAEHNQMVGILGFELNRT